MILVKMMGGLGNQMFQYATGRALSLLHNTPLFLDLSDYKASTREKRPFDLDVFAVEYQEANQNLLSRIPKKSDFIFPFLKKMKQVKEKSLLFDESLSQELIPYYLNGYWQNEKYFKNIRNVLLKELKPKFLSEKLQKFEIELKNKTSVSLHVRRGDLLQPQNLKKHGIVPLSYYQMAVQKILFNFPNAHFFIFSDDPDWTRKEIAPLCPKFTMVSDYQFKNWEDLYLMTQSQMQITANSSFSWWGAWLSEHSEKITYAPETWYAGMDQNSYDIIPQNWVRLKSQENLR